MLSGALALAATNAPATRRGERSSRGHDGLTLCPGFPPEPPTTTCDLLFGILFFYNLLLLLFRLLLHGGNARHVDIAGAARKLAAIS